MAKSDYERFAGQLEEIATAMSNVNVAGISVESCDELHSVTVRVLRLKHRARQFADRIEVTTTELRRGEGERDA